MAKHTITILLKGYPRLSETFIAQEILSLQRRGYAIKLVSLRHPTDKKTHPIHDEITAPVNYLPEYLYLEPIRVLKAWWFWRSQPNYQKTFKIWFQHWLKDRSFNRIRRFGQALVLAAELDEDVRLLYAHFLHTPASVAWYTAHLTDLPWAVSAHAKDIWTSPEWELAEKLADLSWLVTCTEANTHYLKNLAKNPSIVHLQYHGIDLQRFPIVEKKSQRSSSLTLISVGRAVPKKGYPTLLRALSLLPPDLDWRFVHIGGGAEKGSLQQLASKLGLAERIDWLGARPQKEVLAAYREADLFVLASEITGDGDRDGLPNVLMEAQSQGLCCLSTTISGIPELIEHGENGYLVPPKDPNALAQALETLLRDTRYRQQLAEEGLHRLQARFDHQYCMDQLVALLGEPGSWQNHESS